MKRLHKTSPQEWTAEKLSDCFPATPEVCSRIIKSNYSRATQQKIKQIDDEVCNSIAKDLKDYEIWDVMIQKLSFKDNKWLL